MTITINGTLLSATLLLSAPFTIGNASATPDAWEAQLGTTVPARFLIGAGIEKTLDDTNDGTTVDMLTFGSMSFPFAGTVYTGNAILSIASNGFISLGGDNGDGCTENVGAQECSGSPDGLTSGDFARIAPFWTDLDPDTSGGDIFYNSFNDDRDPAIDRIVITFATGFNDCDIGECSTLAQVQLLEDGTIIFGYNGITQTNDQLSDVLVGISPGGDAVDPGGTNLSNNNPPIDSGGESTIYELFSSLPPPAFDLDDTNLIFTPNAAGGFTVSDSMTTPPVSTEPPIWEPALGASISTMLDKADNESVSLSLGDILFPFAGTDYGTVYVSSNGFISLGADNGDGCTPDGDCSGNPDWFRNIEYPLIAPLWTDLDPGTDGGDVYFNTFNDDGDPEDDRAVITFASGLHDCTLEECAVLTQVQLLESGTIIFGYNGITQTDSQGSDILVGVTKGNVFPPAQNTDFTARSPFDTGTVATIYELFRASSPPPIDLDGGNIIFEPTVFGGFIVSIRESEIPAKPPIPLPWLILLME